MALELTCEQFHDGHSLRGPTLLDIDEGIVRRIVPFDGPCSHRLVTPGLVDLQVNGWKDVDVAEASLADLEKLGSALANLGTTAWLATLITAPLDRMNRRIANVHGAVEAGTVPGLVGIHLEGPFLGRSPGAHPVRHIVPADVEWLAALPNSVRLVTLAAETPGAPAAIELLRRRGISVSLGHSSPTRDEFDAALEAGAGLVTHLFNGMSGVHHRDGGLALWALTNPRLAVGVISDMVHLSAETVLLPFLTEHGARPFLVSDSVAWETPWALRQDVKVRDGAPRLPDGTLAGSSTCLAECVRMAVAAGVDAEKAIIAATSRPAGLVGEEGAGVLREGGPATVLAFDDDLRVASVHCRLPSGRG